VLKPDLSISPMSPPRYGLALVGIIAVIVLSAGAGEAGAIGIAALLVQSVVLIFVLRTSSVSTQVARTATIVTAVAVAGAIATQILDGRSATAAAEIVSLLLVIATPIAIVRRLTYERHIEGPIVFGAICLYLLIGLFYSDVYALFDRFDPEPFFVQTDDPTQADFVYFSYITMTTVGYGDLTAAGSLSRMIAVTEALVGQLYLVTVVALVVSRMGMERRSRREVAEGLEGTDQLGGGDPPSS
jgi:hypothetical protein